MNVAQQVVEENWCIGCGMCAAVCPLNRLEMRFNERGEYNPFEVDGCKECGESCLLCYQVCPAHGNTKNETEIGCEYYAGVDGAKYADETGYYLSSYVGFSDKNDHRKNGASGGLATWMLESLIETGAVDAVVAVIRTSNPDKLFEFKICKTTKEVRACSRSAYYPVEISRAIRHILTNEGTYAIVGLPCVCKSIRLAQDKFPKLKKRIKYVLGLTCGHQCSKFFTEYICALGGGNPYELKEFTFRKKDLTQPASNHVFEFSSGNGKDKVVGKVFWRDGVSYAYVNGYFQIPGCFYCDDIFAECADVAFMDAWLPEYEKQPEGHSLVLVRNSRVDKAIREAIGKELQIGKLSVRKVVQSQQGVIDRKRRRNLCNGAFPVLRTGLLKRTGIIQEKILSVQMAMTKESPLKWNSSSKVLLKFRKSMLPLQEQLIKYQKQRRLLLLPVKIYGRIKYILRLCKD
ncbi:Coenzyme F420 hydrogenase/dehydrogenase, beta subunit C-terminal domain [Candidatus Pacearchaeota archaeon]|nr:Coenzyme F420 hydrogenase/dehydrogenase, beta subunit C-terminal domain [Candidatus Pacearchaeota archaeon]